MKSLFLLSLAVGLCSVESGENKVFPQPNRDSVGNSISIARTRRVWRQEDPSRKRVFAKFDISYLKNIHHINSYLIRSFPADFEGIKLSDFSVSDKVGKVQIKGLGGCALYPIHFSESAPEIIGKRVYLIYSDRLRKAAVLFVDTLMSVKIRKSNPENLIGGVYRRKGVGYFTLYNFIESKNQQSLSQVFNTSDSEWCDGGIPVFNCSLDCICYDPFMLHFENVDANQDGLLDLVFSGQVLKFCRGLEKGYGREDRKPLKKETIKIVFWTNESGEELHWKLGAVNICGKLDVQ